MATDHPDAAWVARSRQALDAWLDVPVGTPTSQLTGGGAIEHVEARLSALHCGRPVLLMPSATYGLRAVMAALGVGPGDEVLIPRYDWTASLAAVRSLGATPVPVPTSADTLTIDPAAAAAHRTARTRAVVATHLLGIPADVPALRRALPWVPIIEDCAQAFGSTLDGQPVGVFGDAAVHSFGPGKRLDVGELGAVVLRDAALAASVLVGSSHPIRQQLGGIAEPDAASFSIRPHPLAAVLLNAALDRDDSARLIAGHATLAAKLQHSAALALLGTDARRGVAASAVAVAVGNDGFDVPRGATVSYGAVLDIHSVMAGGTSALRIAHLRSEAAAHPGPEPHHENERR